MKRMVIKFFMLYYSEHKKTASQLLDMSNDWEAVFFYKEIQILFVQNKSMTKKILMIQG